MGGFNSDCGAPVRVINGGRRGAARGELPRANVLDAPAKKSDISTYASAFDALLAPHHPMSIKKPAWGDCTCGGSPRIAQASAYSPLPLKAAARVGMSEIYPPLQPVKTEFFPRHCQSLCTTRVTSCERSPAAYDFSRIGDEIMAETVGNCPRCGARHVTFDVRGAEFRYLRYSWQHWYEVFIVCRRCEKGTIGVFCTKRFKIRKKHY